MKIGIFGDSYGVGFDKEGETISWPAIVSKKYQTTNYAQRASNFFYSYDLLKNFGHKYDKIIFLITWPGRIRCQLEKLPNLNFTCLEHAQSNCDFFTKTNQLNLAKVAQSAADYYKYFFNPNQEQLFNDMLYKKLIEEYKDNINVLFSFSESVSTRNKISLNEITELDYSYYNIEDSYFKYEDTRHCHLNNSNNKILAEKIIGWIETDQFDLDISDFVEPTEPFEYYFSNK